ncbi:hypothetical protein WAK64_06980 [Bacillus spongiae]|uniref:Uncharacterized protein n=1 Tax=Bacillus spongiae TaxID=2683610 RepID=A0ABU8HBV1_9BACI
MSQGFSEKLSIFYSLVEKQNGLHSLPWHTVLNYPFYAHFQEEEIECQSGALFAFWGLLEHWKATESCPFTNDEKNHSFYSYVDEFDYHALSLQRKYPNLVHVILATLQILNRRYSFQKTFPSIDVDWHLHIQDFLLANHSTTVTEGTRFLAYLEAGIVLID